MLSFQPKMPDMNNLLPGRNEPLAITDQHYVNGARLKPPFDTGTQQAVFGLGCFWGAERCFWQLDGIITTAVGYAGGSTPNPTYHEAVLVVFDPARISYEKLLQVFFESHDPTQGMSQGNDVGTQYRSAIYTFDDNQSQAARYLTRLYEGALKRLGYRAITTEIAAAGEFFYAEDYHQQYLAKNPGGYCGLGGTGGGCPGTDSVSAA